MQIDKIIQEGMKYAEDNLAAAISVTVILLFLLFSRPKVILTLVLVALGVVGVLEIFDMLASTGLNRVK
ncbi:MAG: hypothetical protein ABFR82_14180 [Nitrospirota bacterium]